MALHKMLSSKWGATYGRDGNCSTWPILELPLSFLDKTYCASPNCKNECGRQMTSQERSRLNGLKNMAGYVDRVKYGYFCGAPETKCNHEWDGVLLNRPYAGNMGLCKRCGEECYVAST